MEFRTKREAEEALKQAEHDAAMCHENEAPLAAAVYERKAARIRALLPTLEE